MARLWHRLWKVQLILNRNFARILASRSWTRCARCGDVAIPAALARQDPRAARQTGWQWVFPARARSLDLRSGWAMRPHGLASGLQQAVTRAAAPAGLDQQVGCQTPRHRVATPRLEHGVHSRVLQEHLGPAAVKTTAIYTHVMARDSRP